ncbi:hypothetical protein JIN85_18070 [Luteolibacter pohnpeiensis]|uniref:Endonuclease/exonuclease/phosphatase domain-containing protein n=1 Tax=Luteolibacter pohnpeiensis TaxID=454153 RepID=A0A934VSI2_9BACT|nr:endonuclease/exonuclease/phosphatase family protein [Luteolibacter pohnpeiensis]MBK1884331.1 hypothetical protein [Luteolibacter pohnpeiensis]
MRVLSATLCLMILAIASAKAVKVRVASFNVGALYTSDGAQFGLGDPGTTDFESVRMVLGRINADVVALEEIHNVDVDNEPSGTQEDVEVLASELGYPYLYVPPRTSLDYTFRVIFLSKFPFLTETSIGSPSGANDMTRRLPVVHVDVPDTPNDPWIIAGHLKSGTALADRFRRSVELERVREFLETQMLTGDDNFIIMGDFNLSSTNRTFTELPTGLPSSFTLGSDIQFPVTYSTNPVAYFTSPIPSRVDLRQVDGAASTYDTESSGGSAIDVMMVSSSIAGRSLESEIYNSALDTSNDIGLEKNGAPLAADTSYLASDHYAIFADLDLDLDYPNLSMSISPNSVAEAASAVLTVQLPEAATADLTVNLSSDSSAVATTTTSVIIPAGESSASAAIQTYRNYIADGGVEATFTATATGYDPASMVLQVQDKDDHYSFTDAGQTITENFSGFYGSHDPAPFSSSGVIAWIGSDDGSSGTPGFRAYGAPENPSIGLIPAGEASDISATFSNDSTETITALAISMTAAQWRAISGGTTDRLDVALVIDEVAQNVPGLSFSAATDLPTGAIPGGASQSLQTTIEGLSIAPDATFDLRVTFTPGPSTGKLSDDVFINEFHYDNDSTDEGEFVEIAVGPGFTGNLSELSLVLYNGNNGQTYGSEHRLDTFTAGAVTDSGHRLFSKQIEGIQNGSPDGFALVRGSEVLEFISYEGSFTATNGPAAGLTSTDIGVDQNSTLAAGIGSLGLQGTGGSADDFTWTRFSGAFTVGQANDGQTFTSAPRPQGLSFDDLSVTFLAADQNVDSDGDGWSDEVETTLTLTDPNDAASRFRAELTSPESGLLELGFPTLTGRFYTLESSPDLINWEDISSLSGDDQPAAFEIEIDPENPKKFYRIRIELGD